MKRFTWIMSVKRYVLCVLEIMMIAFVSGLACKKYFRNRTVVIVSHDYADGRLRIRF